MSRKNLRQTLIIKVPILLNTESLLQNLQSEVFISLQVKDQKKSFNLLNVSMYNVILRRLNCRYFNLVIQTNQREFSNSRSPCLSYFCMFLLQNQCNIIDIILSTCTNVVTNETLPVYQRKETIMSIFHAVILYPISIGFRSDVNCQIIDRCIKFVLQQLSTELPSY